MAFSNQEWEFSNIEKRPEPEGGLRYLRIENTNFDTTSKIYKIFVEDLNNGAHYSLSYWLLSSDKTTGDIIPNKRTEGTLETLGKALAGMSIGVPHYTSIIGGVVMADVKMTPSKDGSREFPRVYEFFAVPKDIKEGYATIDQYWVGAEAEIGSGYEFLLEIGAEEDAE